MIYNRWFKNNSHLIHFWNVEWEFGSNSW